MRRHLKLFTAALFFTLFLSADRIQADPLIVTSGSSTLGFTPAGSPGLFTFTLEGANFNIQGMAIAFLSVGPYHNHLTPGGTFSLNTVLSEMGSSSDFSFVINGTTFNNLNFIDGVLRLDSGTFTLPVDGTPNLTITDTFQLQGSLHGYEGDNHVLSTQLSGMGTVIMNLTLRQDGLYYLTGLTHRFQSANAPVPEPATLLLLGTGLAGLAAGARRRAAKSKSKG